MEKALSVWEWMEQRRLSLDDLVQATTLERKVLEAVARGRYTPTPHQRQAISTALGVDADAIFWGHINQVEHVYGHGPQFGRSP